MTSPFGPNALGQYIADWNSFQNYVAQARPGAMLVMDQPDLARGAKAVSPKTLVIHRAYNANDPNWHDRKADGSWVFPPAQWLADHTVADVAIAVFNEPSPGNIEKFIDWLVELMALAFAQHIVLVVGNFAVGNPADKAITAGVYDRLIHAIVQYGMWLGVHEYFINDPVAEYPWLCGRFEFWLDRAEALGLKLNLVVTEHGRDLGGGQNDGFNNQPWGQQGYYDRLVAAQALYKKFGIAVCVFCYGTGGGNRWISFDFQHALTLIALLITYGQNNPMTTPVPALSYDISKLGAAISGRVYSTVSKTANIRKQPNQSAEIVGSLVVGQSVMYRPMQTELLDSFKWTYVEAPVTGFVASVAVIVPAALEKVLALIPIPFTSQIDMNSNNFADDCGPACVNMDVRWDYVLNHRLDPIFITVNDMSRHTKLAAGKPGLFPEDLVALAAGYGLTMVVRKDLTPSLLSDILVRGKTVTLLVNYQHINAAQTKSLGHYIKLFGVTDQGNFKFHDPYLLQANRVINTPQLLLAMTDTLAFAAPNQGVILA